MATPKKKRQGKWACSECGRRVVVRRRTRGQVWRALPERDLCGRCWKAANDRNRMGP